METITFAHDIDVYCITAQSFPDTVKQAHMDLHALVSFNTNRKYFGISWYDVNGAIVYKAAASELYEGELKHLNLERRTIKKGLYQVMTIRNFMDKIPDIGKAFDTLGELTLISEDNMAVEWYFNESDVHCMVRVK